MPFSVLFSFLFAGIHVMFRDHCTRSNYEENIGWISKKVTAFRYGVWVPRVISALVSPIRGMCVCVLSDPTWHVTKPKFAIAK